MKLTDNKRNGEIKLHKEKINLIALSDTVQEISMAEPRAKDQ